MTSFSCLPAARASTDRSMPKKVQVGNQEFSEKENKRKWLTKTDLKGIPAVLKAEHVKKLKQEAVQLAMARLARNQHADGLAKALKQQLAGYGNVAELNKIARAAPTAGKRRAAEAQAPAHSEKTQQLFQELFQLLDGAGSQPIYKPMVTEGDGPDLPENRVLGVIDVLDTKFLNRTVSSFAASEQHHLAKTPEEIAKEKAAEAEKKAAEEAAEQAMVTAGSKLQDMMNKQLQLKAEQATKLSQLGKTLDDVLNPQGYSDADITQCGDHCAEVQIAAARQAESAQAQAEREEENRELGVPADSRRRR